MWQCSQQHENRDEAKFCGKCGEKHDARPRCSACGSFLEPEDAFCTSCGHRRDSAPTPAPVKPEPAPVVAPVAPVQPIPIEPPVPAAEANVATVPQEEPKGEEPVTFSFGGTMIEMKDDTKPTGKAAKPATGARGGGMSSTTSAILSFALIAAVLGLAFYLVTR